MASWSVPSPQVEQDKIRHGIDQVIAFAKRSGLAEHITKKLEARLESYPKLPSVVLCRVSQGALVSHPASWVVAFVEAESFRLGGFGDETEFDRFVRRLRLEIKDGDAAIGQVQVWVDLVLADPNFQIVHNRKQLRPMVEAKFSWAGKNAKEHASKWLAGVPSFVLKRLEPPTALRYESTGDYIVHLFALRQSPYDLSFDRYEFRVETDGNVVLQRKIKLNVTDWE